jgi:tetratricopeptide (TPR) repeat protein
MGLLDVYDGRETWAEYLRGHEPPAPSEIVGAVKVGLSPRDYELALESGLGALAAVAGGGQEESECSVELNVERLAGGIERLNADFNLLLGDLIWKCEMREEALNHLLEEIRLAEFEREARAYRSRAERAYLNGWYEEALGDFLEAEKRNYPDYAVHRSIASIYLYHLIDLPRALTYFRQAAKYARPSDVRQSAEAHYFAGMVCALERQPEEGRRHLREAVRLNPQLHEAHYQHACLSALLGEREDALTSLEAAIRGDARYHERARGDAAFDALRDEVRALLDRLMLPVLEKAEEVRHDAEALKGYVIARPEEEKFVSALREIEGRMAAPLTYRAGLGVLDTLAEIQGELRGLRDRFHKQYEVDPRDYVRSVAFSGDGRLVAAGLLHGGLQVWEVDSGLKVFSALGHLMSVNSVAFSPNSLWLASASRDRTIKLWEAGGGGEVLTLRGHDDVVSSVAFSPDSQWLISASHDRTIKLWRAATGQEALTLAGHAREATAAVFSPDGAVIASGSWDRTIKLWDVASGVVARTLEGHARGVAALAFSPDGRWIASGGEGGEVKLWDAAAGCEVRSFDGHRNSVTSVAFSPDGGLLAAGSLGQTVIVWKAATGEALRRLHYENISYNSVAFSPQGQWLALGSRDLELWLKVILTPEEHAAVKAGEERALSAKRRAEERALPAFSL